MIEGKDSVRVAWGEGRDEVPSLLSRWVGTKHRCTDVSSYRGGTPSGQSVAALLSPVVLLCRMHVGALAYVVRAIALVG